MKSGLCLSFADNFAKNLIQMLDDGTFGILYEVCIENKVEMDWKIFCRWSFTKNILTLKYNTRSAFDLFSNNLDYYCYNDHNNFFLLL